MFYRSTNFLTSIFIVFAKVEMLKTKNILDFLIPIIWFKSLANKQYAEIRVALTDINKHLPLILYYKGYNFRGLHIILLFLLCWTSLDKNTICQCRSEKLVNNMKM